MIERKQLAQLKRWWRLFGQPIADQDETHDCSWCEGTGCDMCEICPRCGDLTLYCDCYLDTEEG